MRNILARIASVLALKPLLCAVCVALILLVTAPGLGMLKVDTSTSGLIIDDDPATRDYEEITETFGEDVAFSVIYRSDRLFTPEVLESIDAVTFALEDIDGVTRVISLSTVNDLRAEGETLNTDLLMALPPATQAQADEIGRRALGNPMLVGEVVGKSGKAAQISAFIEERPDDRGFERRTLRAIEAILAKHAGDLGPSVETYVSGPPVVAVAILENILADGLILGPLAILIVALVFFAFFRSMIVVILPILTGLASIWATLGFMGWIGFELNPLSIIIPPLLLTIGATEDIHLMSEYANAIARKLGKVEAISAMMGYCSLPIFLTSLTTTIGFLTLAPNDIPVISEFGIAASFGMAINLVLTVTITPLLARAMAPPAPREARASGAMAKRISGVVLLHRRWIAVFGVALFVVCGALAMRVEVDSSIMNLFEEDAPVIRNFEEQSKDVAGAAIVVVEVDTHAPQGLQDPAVLKSMAQLTDFIMERHDDVVSYDLFIRQIHQVVNEGDERFYAVPDRGDLIAQYSLMIDPQALSRIADFELSQGLLIARTRLESSSQVAREIEVLNAYADRVMPPDVDVTFSGARVLIAKAAEQLSREVVKGLFYVLCAILVVLALFFGSLRLAALSIIPNLFPVVGVFAMMVLLGIPLDTSVFPVAIIAVGIAVDDTIHFISRFTNLRSKGNSPWRAIRTTIATEFRPIVTSSVALIAGFSMLTMASFGSIQQFGILGSVAMFLALIADLAVTPSLLLLARKNSPRARLSR